MSDKEVKDELPILMEWWSMGLAIAIAAMAALRVTHPPAGADPLVLDNPEWGISGCPSRLEV